MKNLTKTNYFKLIFIIPLFLISFSLSAQDNEAYEKAKNEIEQTFGTFLSTFEAYPKHALSTAWENYKNLSGPGSSINSKFKELIQLAVASQIPCLYCVYFHKISSKASGATDEEIKEAIALGAQTRQWSMITQGSGISRDDFKAEFDAAMKYMEEQSKK